MVQRKLPNKLSIKPLLLKSDIKPANLRPPSPKSHDHLKKMMKKPGPTTRSAESRPPPPQPPPPIRKKRKHDAGETPQNQSPNYMKSTTSFDARKERKVSTPKANSVKPLKTSGLKVVRTFTKIPSFKPSKKCSPVMLNARRTTCSSTLKDAKFPSYLELSHGGTELEGTSAVKVCPYNYCSLNGHRHAPLPPLRCFLAAKRRALKTQKSLKVGCLSPRQTKRCVKKNEEIVGEQVMFADEGPEAEMEVRPVTPVMEEEDNRDFFVEIYSKEREDLECSAMDWEEGYCSSPCVDDGKTLKSPGIGDDDDHHEREEQIQKTGFESLYSGLQELYDEESVSSGAWSESDDDYDYESEGLYQQMKTNHENEIEIDEGENMGIEAKADELECLSTGDHEETSLESETVPDFAKNSPDGSESTNKHHTTIIYNIIQYNISIFFNGEKTEHSKPDRILTVQVPATSDEVNQIVSDENPPDAQVSESTEQLDTCCLTDTEEGPEREYDESQACSQSNSMDFESDKQSEIDEESTSLSYEKPEISGEELPNSDEEEPASKLEGKPAISGEDLQESSMDLKELTRRKKTDTETEDSGEYNLRGPNFLPEVADPDAETVDLRHQTIDERRNSEEWMVDFALQQAVTTLAPARKKKVALLVEAFEKVLPTPKYGSNGHASKAFTDARPMQACS